MKAQSLKAQSMAIFIIDSWPGQMRTLTAILYFIGLTSPPTKGQVATGDGCRRDEDGYY